MPMSELLDLEADQARIELAIHCIKSCDPSSFVSYGELAGDGYQMQQKLIAPLNAAKQGMAKKFRSITQFESNVSGQATASTKL